ncbi:MAG: hypothetical protein ACXWT2_09750 [Methylovulum sp.]
MTTPSLRDNHLRDYENGILRVSSGLAGLINLQPVFSPAAIYSVRDGLSLR